MCRQTRCPEKVRRTDPLTKEPSTSGATASPPPDSTESCFITSPHDDCASRVAKLQLCCCGGTREACGSTACVFEAHLLRNSFRVGVDGTPLLEQKVLVQVLDGNSWAPLRRALSKKISGHLCGAPPPQLLARGSLSCRSVKTHRQDLKKTRCLGVWRPSLRVCILEGPLQSEQ